MVQALLSFLSQVIQAVREWFHRLDRNLEKHVEIGRRESDRETLEEIQAGQEARDRVLVDPTYREQLLDEILVRSSSDEDQLVLSELPSGVPERDGSSINYSGNTWKLRDVSELVYPFSARSLTALATCHPILQFLVRELAMEMDITVLEGNRSMAKQQEYFDSGQSKVPPGKSKHNRMPSDAVDVCPADAPKRWANGGDLPRERYQEVHDRLFRIAKMNGIDPLRWGGDWDGDGDYTDQDFNDLVHFEIRDA